MQWNSETLLLAFVAFTGVAVLMQALVLLGIFLSLRRAARSAMEVTSDLRATVVPLVQSTRELIERVTPQILAASQNMLDLTEGIRAETSAISESASVILDRVNRQTVRLDRMLSAGFDSVDRATAAIETAVLRPVRQANTILNAARAMVNAYCAPRGRKQESRKQEIS